MELKQTNAVDCLRERIREGRKKLGLSQAMIWRSFWV